MLPADFDGLGEEGDLRQARPGGGRIETPAYGEYHAPRGATPLGTRRAVRCSGMAGNGEGSLFRG